MISRYTKKNLSKILHVINDAASKYKGVIPDDCWHEPYMSPVYQLLGGTKNIVPCYVTGGYYQDGKTVSDLVEECESYVDQI